MLKLGHAICLHTQIKYIEPKMYALVLEWG